MVLVVKNLPPSAGDVRDMHWIPGSGRSPRGRHGNPLIRDQTSPPCNESRWSSLSHWTTGEVISIMNFALNSFILLVVYQNDRTKKMIFAKVSILNFSLTVTMMQKMNDQICTDLKWS